MISLYSRAISEYPADPRAYYCLGVIYYAIFQEPMISKQIDRTDVQDHPWEIQENMRQIREFREKNQGLVQAFGKSKLIASREEVSK